MLIIGGVSGPSSLSLKTGAEIISTLGCIIQVVQGREECPPSNRGGGRSENAILKVRSPNPSGLNLMHCWVISTILASFATLGVVQLLNARLKIEFKGLGTNTDILQGAS